MKQRAAILLGVFALFFAAISAGSTGGHLKGTFSETDGSPLSGASVNVSSPALIGGPQTAVTNDRGEFLFLSLPVGLYEIEAMSSGRSSKIADVRVLLNQTVHVVLRLPADEGAEHTPSHVLPIDTDQVSASQNFDQQYLQHAGVGAEGRSYLSMTQQTPGTSGDGQPSNLHVFGGLPSDNNYVIDGISTSDPVSGTAAVRVTYDAVEQISVQTGGYEAEFGQATGGIISMVTKSGGNEFSGSLDIRYRDQSFNENGDHYDKDESPSSYQSIAATLGGPIVRDRLWFFASYEQFEGKEPRPVGQPWSELEGSAYLAKLTWQIAKSHRLAARYSGDPWEIPVANESRFVMPEASSTREMGGTVLGVSYHALLSEHLLLDVGFGSMSTDYDLAPASGSLHRSSHIDSDTNVISNNFGTTSSDSRERSGWDLSMTWIVDSTWGSHELKLGAELSDQDRWRSQWTNGAGTLIDRGFDDFDDINGDGYNNYQVTLRQPSADEIPGYNPDGSLNGAALALLGPESSSSRTSTFFAQDTWRILPNLTVKPGVRFDNVQLTNANDEKIADMDRWQPRIGLAWDIKGDDRYVARASWGRFMDPTALSIAGYASGQIRTYRSYTTMEYLCNTSWTCDRSLLEMLYGPSFEWTNGEGFTYVLFPSQRPRTYSPGQTLDQAGFGNLEAPYSDQLILAFEWQVAPESSIEFTYVDKRTEQLIEDTCSNNTWVWDSSAPRPDVEDPTTWTTTGGCDTFIVTNFDDLYREYNAFITKFETRGANWHGLISWTYSDSKGNTQTPASNSFASGENDYFPLNFFNIDGYLDDHRQHRIKVGGYWMLPRNWTFGVNAWWSDAGRITTASSCFAYRDASQEALDFYGISPDAQEYCATPDGGNLSGYNILLEPRGASKTESLWNADLSITKGFTIGTTTTALILSVYNLFGQENVTEFDSTAFRSNYEGGYVPIGQPLSWSVPRRYELGFRLSF